MKYRSAAGLEYSVSIDQCGVGMLISHSLAAYSAPECGKDNNFNLLRSDCSNGRVV